MTDIKVAAPCNTIFAQTHSVLSTIISELKRSRCRGDLENILRKHIYLLSITEGLHSLFVNKKTSAIVDEISIDLPNGYASSFKSTVMSLYKKHWTDDEIFEQQCSTNDWVAVSHGLSLFYERNACFLCLPKSVDDNEQQVVLAKSLLPFIHIAFNNTLHYKNSCQSVSLSCRQRQIVEWIAKGKTNKEIAIILSVSQFTVKNHVANIYEKLNVVNRAQAIEKLMRMNYLD